MKKLRPCLRCDRKFLTTIEVRICQSCKRPEILAQQASESGIQYNRTFIKPVNTRGVNQ